MISFSSAVGYFSRTLAVSSALLLLGCHGAGSGAVGSVSTNSPKTSAVKAPPPIPHVTWQTRDARVPGNTLLLPEHTWFLLSANGLSLSDESDLIRANLFTVHRPESFGFVQGTNKQEIVVLFNAAMPIAQGMWNIGSLPRFNLVERWNIATKKRIWSKYIPDLQPLPGSEYYSVYGRITVSSKGAFVTRCHNSRQFDVCVRTTLRLEDGAVTGQSQNEPGYGLALQSMEMRVDTDDGRFSLQSARNLFDQRGPRIPWWVFDDEGRVQGYLQAECARFDLQNRLWLHAPDPRYIAITGKLGLQVSEGKQGCVRNKQAFIQPPGAPLVGDLNQDTANITTNGDRLAWQHQYGPEALYLLDTKTVGLPKRIDIPRGPEKYGFRLSRATTGFVGIKTNKIVVYDDDFANPREFDSPLNAEIHREGNLLLVHGIPFAGGGDPDYPQLRLGAIPASGAITWKSLQGTTQYSPDTILAEENGKPIFVLAGGRAGIQKYDVATGRRLAHFCVDKKSDGRLCNGEKTVGILATSDNKAIWMYQSADENGPNNPSGAFVQLDLASGRVLRRVRSPRITFDFKNGYFMGWLEQDKRFWFTGTCDTRHVIAVVSIPDSGAEPSIEFFPGRGRASSTTGHVDGKFIAEYHSNGVIDFVAGDGEPMLMMANEADGFMAQARDGRFACTNKACESFRCIVGTDVRPVTDAACAHLRVDGFSVQEEMKKAR